MGTTSSHHHNDARKLQTKKCKHRILWIAPTNFFDCIATFDLSAALDYYGSDRARVDFHNNREPNDAMLQKGMETRISAIAIEKRGATPNQSRR